MFLSEFEVAIGFKSPSVSMRRDSRYGGDEKDGDRDPGETAFGKSNLSIFHLVPGF